MNEYSFINGNHVHHTAVIGENVKIGTGNVIMPYAVIGQTGFIRNAMSANGTIRIGDGNKIGCHACIMAGENGETVIGDENLIMNFVNIGHDVIIGNNCEIGVGAIVAGYAQLGDRVKVKIGAAIRNRKKVGSDVVIGMCGVVVKDVDSESLVFGNPATHRDKKVQQNIPNISRRHRFDLFTPAELAIRNAIDEVEKVGADPKLTSAVNALSKAQDLVADYIEETTV